MTSHVAKVSLWYGDEPATKFSDCGRLLDPDSEPYKALKLPITEWQPNRPARSVVDWSVTVTTRDGDTFHSEITAQEREYGHMRFTLPEQTAVFLP